MENATVSFFPKETSCPKATRKVKEQQKRNEEGKGRRKS
jgi:hypothetical protein